MKMEIRNGQSTYKNRQGLVLDSLSDMNICSEGKLIECCKLFRGSMIFFWDKMEL